jgi:hypothetical protein
MGLADSAQARLCRAHEDSSLQTLQERALIEWALMRPIPHRPDRTGPTEGPLAVLVADLC